MHKNILNYWLSQKAKNRNLNKSINFKKYLNQKNLEPLVNVIISSFSHMIKSSTDKKVCLSIPRCHGEVQGGRKVRERGRRKDLCMGCHILFLRYRGESWWCCFNAFCDDIEGAYEEDRHRSEPELSIALVRPSLIDSQAHCDNYDYVKKCSEGSVGNFKLYGRGEIFQWVAVLGGDSSEDASERGKVREQPKVAVIRLVMRITVVVLVHINARLGNRNKNNCERLENPMSVNSFIVSGNISKNALTWYG